MTEDTLQPLNQRRARRSMTKFLSLVFAVSAGAAAMWWLQTHARDETPPQPPLMSLEAMGTLATVKVNYANVVEFTEKLTLGIPWTLWEPRFGGTRVLLVARGDCMVGTDLRVARYENKNDAGRTADLVLAAPKPISARVNHDTRDKGGSYFYAINGTGLEPLNPGSGNRAKAIDAALGKAQKEIELACNGPAVLATAMKNAEAVLKPAFAVTGWDIRVRWLPS